ncbi:MAG TPA: hypothetical protein PKN29_03665 [Candidatus Ozemobacteraceae bacterium]|nr:hypothetical protein [Candidatus Ozemobacteraceae bacterium]
MIDTIRQNLNLMVIEAAELNRHLLLWQIGRLEDELLPCEQQLEECLQTISRGGRIADRAVIERAAQTAARLRRLQNELQATEQLMQIATEVN